MFIQAYLKYLQMEHMIGIKHGTCNVDGARIQQRLESKTSHAKQQCNKHSWCSSSSLNIDKLKKHAAGLSDVSRIDRI